MFFFIKKKKIVWRAFWHYLIKSIYGMCSNGWDANIVVRWAHGCPWIAIPRGALSWFSLFTIILVMVHGSKIWFLFLLRKLFVGVFFSSRKDADREEEEPSSKICFLFFSIVILPWWESLVLWSRFFSSSCSYLVPLLPYHHPSLMRKSGILKSFLIQCKLRLYSLWLNLFRIYSVLFGSSSSYPM